MPTIGTYPALNLQTVDRDETVYKTASHNVSHTDVVAFRRTLPRAGGATPLRTQLRAERGFAVTGGVGELPATVSIAVTAPSGVDSAAVEAWVALICAQAATTIANVAVTGDIHLT